jgi:hypothetical protein
MPDTVDKALNMAISVTQAELSDRDNSRENRADRQTVFAVKGNCRNTRNNYTDPRREIQWSRYRDGGFRNGTTGLEALGNKGAIKGNSSFRTDCQTAVSRSSGTGLDQGRYQGTTDRRHRDRRVVTTAERALVVTRISSV